MLHTLGLIAEAPCHSVRRLPTTGQISMPNSEPSSPSPSVTPTLPSNQEPLRLPEKVSVRWLIDHVPVLWWVWAVSGLAAIFVAGTQANRLPILQQFMPSSSSPSPTTIRPPEHASEDVQKIEPLQHNSGEKQQQIDTLTKQLDETKVAEAALRKELDATKRELANAKQASALIAPHNSTLNSPPANLNHTYPARSPTEADKEIGVINRLIDILQKEAAHQFQEGLDIISNWQDAFDDQKNINYVQSLSAFHDKVRETNGRIWNLAQVNETYFCKNDICDIVDPRNNDNVAVAFDNFSVFLDHLKSITDVDKFNRYRGTSIVGDVAAPEIDRVRDQLSRYRNWIAEVESELISRRKSLSEIAGRRP